VFALFKNHHDIQLSNGNSDSLPDVAHVELDFSAFPAGIDNIHIDVQLSPKLIDHIRQVARNILIEYGTGNKRIRDKPSNTLRERLNNFTSNYAELLETVTHQSKNTSRIDYLRLFQVSVTYALQHIIYKETEQLINQLREDALRSPRGSHKTVELHERASRLARQQHSLVSYAAQLLFAQMQWVENSNSGALRESLLGRRWPIPAWVLFNPMLIYAEQADEDIQSQHYIIFHQNPEHPFSFPKLDELIDTLLKYVVAMLGLQDNSAEANLPHQFTWTENPDYINTLFSSEDTKRAISWCQDNAEKQALKLQLKSQQKAVDLLVKGIRQAGILHFISAAYSTPVLYPAFAYALKPYMLFRTLCGDMALELAEQKVEVQQKLRKKPRQGDTWEPISLIAKTKKEAARQANSDAEDLSTRFIQDFVRYRRDLKARSLLQHAMQRIHLLCDEQEIRLSRSNGMLQTFLLSSETDETDDRIRGHAMLKADIRGSTTIVTELKKRGLNPATHFSLNFFQPINEFLSHYNAEKVFIEGDAVILTIFEKIAEPDQWFCVARACGLAVDMLQVVEAQNIICRKHQLPLLELGIGICFEEDAPTFLYDGEHRIMISDAIGKADRLSSCSWALRRKFAKLKLPTHVMVFEQPAGQFKGEKGVTTLRYNLNGIELDEAAFAKLCGEITLRPVELNFKNNVDTLRFFAGQFPNSAGDMQPILIRQGQVRLWQEAGKQYPATDKAYYEVMNPKRFQRFITF
jgi:hypothetical protein